VRELENVIERSVTLTRHPVILPEDLPGASASKKGKMLQKLFLPTFLFPNWEKLYIQKILEETGETKKDSRNSGNRTAGPSIGWRPATD